MNEWEEWKAAIAEETVIYPHRLKIMHAMYGRTLQRACGTCKHLVIRKYAGTYYKCRKTAMTNGPATDWRVRWPACGLHEDK